VFLRLAAAFLVGSFSGSTGMPVEVETFRGKTPARNWGYDLPVFSKPAF